ncbi:MAG: hypothetical protein GBAus27B_000289 [Mycoplasmataceae bacterium]|nr:MAG: hypothetical protein GBAus27B_000289 [Mycoplasmataceae bacterium]
MHLPEYQSKFTIKDIELKTDKNLNSYYLLHFDNSNYQKGYAFKNTLNPETWTALESPWKLVNQRVNIAYSLNQTPFSTFLQVKSISLIN